MRVAGAAFALACAAAHAQVIVSEARIRPLLHRFEPRGGQRYQQIWEDLRDEGVIGYERAKQKGGQ